MVLEPDKLGVENHSIHNILVEIQNQKCTKDYKQRDLYSD